MRALRDKGVVVALFASVCGLLSVVGCGGDESASSTTRVQDLPPSRLVLSEAAKGLKSFPCEQCHNKIDTSDLSPEGKRKHREIETQHFPSAGDCYTCHDPEQRNALRLLTGEKVAFTESHLVCGQCHMEKAGDWAIGAHGKDIGGWRGRKHRSECSDCHNPHSPKRPAVEAKPAPPIPRFAIPKGKH